MAMVKVRWLVQKPGWITTYNQDVADRLVAKGKAEIVTEEEIDAGTDYINIDGLNKEQLMSLAEERDVKVARTMSKKDIIAAINAGNDDEDDSE